MHALEKIANLLRSRIIETSFLAHVPHLGSCLSCIDILVTLYWEILNINPKCSNEITRDRFILSKGHAAPALFQVLAMKNFFPERWLETYGQDGSLFGEHPPAYGVPGVEVATGSLGHGLPIGAGLALGSKMQNINNRIFVLMSDGECNEGSVWEAAMFASVQQLQNLTVIIDFNKWQATGRSREILSLDPLHEKWSAFGFDVCEIDGHCFAQIGAAINRKTNRPSAIIAHTIKGKGVSFMEDDNNWHYRIPTQEEVIAAKKELGVMLELA